MGAEGLRKEVDLLVLVCEEVVEFVVEHADDFGAFVADDTVRLFVVEDGDCEAAFVVGFVVEVNIAQVCEGAVQWVWGSVGSWDIFVRSCEAPAWLRIWISILLSQLGSKFELSFLPCGPRCQCTDVYGMMSSRPFSLRVIRVRCAANVSSQFWLKVKGRKLTPRAGVGDIEVVSIFLRWELSSRFPRDPVSEDRRLTFELPGFIGRVHPISNFSRVSCLRDVSISARKPSKCVEVAYSHVSCGGEWWCGDGKASDDACAERSCNGFGR